MALGPNPGSATNRRDRVWICSLQSGAQSPPFSGGKSLAEAGGTIDKERSGVEWSELVMDAVTTKILRGLLPLTFRPGSGCWEGFLGT